MWRRSFIIMVNLCGWVCEGCGGWGDGVRVNASEAARESSLIYG